MLNFFCRTKHEDPLEETYSLIPFFHKNKVHNHRPHRIHHYNNIMKQTVAGNNKVGFDDVFYMIQQISLHEDPKTCPYLLINTLSLIEQDFLIKNTLSYQIEEPWINDIIRDASVNLDAYVIVLYGINCVDDSVDKKYKQLRHLGFKHVFIYYGGLFEWVLLQDVYGEDRFPTEGSKRRDLIQLAPLPKFTVFKK